MTTCNRSSIVRVLLVIIIAANAQVGIARDIKNLVCAEIGPVLNVPAGDWTDANLSAGLGAHVALLAAIPSGQVLEISAGVLAPSSKDRNFSFVEFPISATLLFAANPENSSTAYFGVGPSWALTHNEFKYRSYENGTWKDRTDKSEQGRIGYNLVSGYLFAPEQFAKTIFDLRLRHTQFIVADASDIRNFDFMVSIGLKL